MFSNIRLRLYLLVLFTTLPFILYLIFARYQNIQEKRALMLEHLYEIANLTASEYKQINEGARQLLIAISTNQELLTRNRNNCNSYLANLQNSYVRYLNFGVIDSTGRVLCAADFTQATLNPPNPTLIQQTLSSQEFTIGSYYPLKPHGSVINFAYPLSRQQLIYTSLSLDWVSDFTNNFNLPKDDLVINILDRYGTVLARNPATNEATGQNFATDPLIKEIIAQGSGQTTKMGIDQIRRLYAFTALDDTHTTFIAVGIAEKDIFTTLWHSLLVDLVIILGIITLSLILTQQIGQIMIIKQVESLQALDKLKNEFVSLASHQIRSPLTAIRWLSESLLESRKPLASKQHAALLKIHATTLRLITLTSNLLNISRLESGSLSLRLTAVPIRQLIRSIISDHDSMSHHSQVKLGLHVRSNLKLTTDPNLLREILVVLINNAIKYSTPHQTVKITADQTASQTTINIVNTGIGIPKSAENYIFTRFYRADNARSLHPDGNGLGLHLARLIAHKLGGSLTFHSRNSLTTFALTLPNKV